MKFVIFLFLVLIAVIGYFSQLNPNHVIFFLTPEKSINLSITSLILFSIATGGLLVMIVVGVRQTHALYLNWTYRRRQKKEASLEKFYKEGVNAFLAKRYKDAVSLFQKVLDINPDHLNTLIRLGKIHKFEKNLPEAIRLYRKARVADDKNMEVLFGLSQNLSDAHQSDEAVMILKEIVDADDHNLTALIRLRDIYVGGVRWQEAHFVQEKIIKLSLSDEDRQKEQTYLLGIKFEKGMIALKQNQIEPARQAFKSTVKLNKDFLPGYMGLGETYVKSERMESALTLFEKGYGITKNIILLHRLETLCLDMGQPERILQAYQQALLKDPRNIALKFYLGKLYHRLEMIDEAFDLLSEIDSQIKYFPDVHKILGDLYLRRGDALMAAETFRKGLASQMESRSKTEVIVPYYCHLCDHQTPTWQGRCARCGQWDSYQAIPFAVQKDSNKLMPTVSSEISMTAKVGDLF
jgi:tetratricopeptide (TPR) repeat protein